MKTVFITGASAGLGKAAALLFAANGWKVIATMRHPGKETELNTQPNTTLLQLDVTDTAQIAAATQQALALGPVDVVVNNAGYGLIGPLETTTEAQIMQQVNTNFLGVVRVTQAFIPHFRERKSGMFINITSIGGLVAFPFSPLYHATKWALEGFSESLSFEMAQLGITVKTVSPGAIQSDFMSRSIQTAPVTPAYQDMMNTMYGAFEKLWPASSFSAPETIAEVIYEAATDGRDQLRYQAGADAKEFYAQRLWQGAEVFRKGIAETVFGSSEPVKA